MPLLLFLEVVAEKWGGRLTAIIRRSSRNKPPLPAGWVHNWHISMLAAISYLALSVILYSLSIVASRKAPDYRDQDHLAESCLDATGA